MGPLNLGLSTDLTRSEENKNIQKGLDEPFQKHTQGWKNMHSHQQSGETSRESSERDCMSSGAVER